MQLDIVKFVSGLHDYIGKALSPLTLRIKALEERDPLPGLKGDPGDPGLPGEHGEPGKDAEPIELSAVIAELSVAPEIRTVIDLLVAEAVAAHLAENPPAPGKDGDPGRDGVGEKGDPGAYGIGIAGALIDREGGLVVTLSNGEAKSLGPVVGKDGDPGKDGADGFNLDDFAAEYDGEKTLRLVFARDDLRKEYEFTLPVVIDKGYWREGMGSKAGDGVTHAGSFWIAKRDNASKPCAENVEDWRLCVRKGRDGDPGPVGKAYVPPDPIKLETAQ